MKFEQDYSGDTARQYVLISKAPNKSKFEQDYSGNLQLFVL